MVRNIDQFIAVTMQVKLLRIAFVQQRLVQQDLSLVMQEFLAVAVAAEAVLVAVADQVVAAVQSLLSRYELSVIDTLFSFE